ncbi:MAG: DUF4350 domain-containing protein [Clostridiales bacterium]
MRKFLKDKILTITIFLIIGISIFILLSINDKYEIDYTTYSTKDYGTKALFLLTKNLNFNVKRYQKPARFLKNNHTLIIIKPSMKRFLDPKEQKKLLSWIKSGNELIISSKTSTLDNNIIKNLVPINKNQYLEYKLGNGKIYLFEEYDDFTNINIKNNESVVYMVNLLIEINNKNVFFNEYYHDYGKSNPGIFSVLNIEYTILIFQCFLTILLFIFYKSRRFGFPLTVLENEKRLENENVYAISNIIRKSNSNSMVVETYLNEFRKSLEKHLNQGFDLSDDELITHSKSDKILIKNNTAQLIIRANNYIKNDNNNPKEMLNIVKSILKNRKELL